VAKPKLSSLSDKQLVALAQKGEKAAYGELVNRWQNSIYTYCFRQLPNSQIAEEITQDIFVSAYKSLKSFRNEAQFSTWLYRIATNRCKNDRAYRNRRNYGAHEPLEGTNPDFVREIPDERSNPEQELHASSCSQILQEALSQLDEKHKEVLILFAIQGLPQAEIATILSIPIGTIKSRLNRARTELSNRLKGKISREELGD